MRSRGTALSVTITAYTRMLLSVNTAAGPVPKPVAFGNSESRASDSFCGVAPRIAYTPAGWRKMSVRNRGWTLSPKGVPTPATRFSFWKVVTPDATWTFEIVFTAPGLVAQSNCMAEVNDVICPGNTGSVKSAEPPANAVENAVNDPGPVQAKPRGAVTTHRRDSNTARSKMVPGAPVPMVTVLEPVPTALVLIVMLLPTTDSTLVPAAKSAPLTRSMPGIMADAGVPAVHTM